MNLWSTRSQSVQILSKEFKQESDVINKTFVVIDECIDLFDRKASDSDYHRICGLVLAKSRNYGLGAYSLILDGLGQEAGALMRPFIEYHELLTYFRLDPSRIQQAIDDDLPSAGNRAKLIKGYFKDFREHLNIYASHSSLKDFSIGHLFESPEMKIRKVQPFIPDTLYRNMGDFFVQLSLMTHEAINCLQSVDLGSADKQASDVEELRILGIEAFKFDERLDRK